MNATLRAGVLALGVPLLWPSLALAAQPTRTPDAARLARAIDRLAVVARVLYVAAHPDDENTKLLAWLANDRLARTAYLSLTRGDGGQNLIGAEQGIDLGIIRTQELLAARRVDGAEQLFTRARDFGYSKSPEETLAVWGKDEVLADVVRAIRGFRPDVVITRFPTSGLSTHGHHTASAILAGEAYRLAADPSYRPEQVKELGTWKAQRLVQNKPTFGAKPGETFPDHLAVDVGGYDAALGLSYGELAADSRSMHKSQGFGVARTRGPSLEYLKVIDGAPMKSSVFEGIDVSWARVAGGKKLAGLLARARKDFELAHPERALPALAAAQAELGRLPASPLTQDKLAELAEVMAACAGLHLEASASDHVVVPGSTLPITMTVLNRSSAKVQLDAVRLSDGTELAVGKSLEHDKPWTQARGLPVAADAPISNPYWLDAAPRPGLFTVADPRLVGLPERPSPLAVDFFLTIAGARLKLRRTAFHAWVDPVAGERYRTIEITPAVTITPGRPLILCADDKPRELRLRLKAAAADAQGEVRLELPEGWSAEPARRSFMLGARGSELELSFSIRPPHTSSEGMARAVVELGGARLTRGLARIEHPHIPIQTRFPEAEVKLARIELAHARTRIGYVPGAGDEVATALREVGYEVTLLSDAMLRDEPLGRFEAIVTGVRAFNTNERLPFVHARLMAYVAAGGTLLVQYNTQNRISSVPTEIGPYPFQISQDRVTDENAPITAARHAVLDAPNRIGPADWAGWVQERGLYFAGSWDPRYEAPLSMHDGSEPARSGSLLIARVGKGAFIYTGLSFFRQLPQGVPGAFRLFANLLDHGR